MTGHKKKAKTMTFRQRLRVDVDEQLSKLVVKMVEAAHAVCKDTALNPFDLMAVCQPKEVKSLRHKMVTELANAKEADLERIYNSQQDLGLETKGDKSETKD